MLPGTGVTPHPAERLDGRPATTARRNHFGERGCPGRAFDFDRAPLMC